MTRGLSSRTLRALAVFGLDVPRAVGSFAAWEERAARRGAARVLRLLRGARGEEAQCILITGPSGAGKSTALRLAARRLARRGVRCVRAEARSLEREERTPVELVRGALAGALAELARAGLADATLLARPARLLSDGQRWRLALAMAAQRARTRESAARAGARGVVLADEFGAGLDLVTALGVARAMGGDGGITLIAASSREELARATAGMAGWHVVELR